MTTPEPLIVEPVMQKDVWDCGVACLMMLTGASYPAVRGHIRAKAPTGLSTWQMRRVAAALGCPVRSQAGGTLDHDDVGVLDLEREGADGTWDGHYVFYAKGTLYNPASGQWWMDAEAYLAQSGYRVVRLLLRTEEA